MKPVDHAHSLSTSKLDLNHIPTHRSMCVLGQGLVFQTRPNGGRTWMNYDSCESLGCGHMCTLRSTASLYVDGIGYDAHNDVIATSLSYLSTCRAVHNSKPDLANSGRSRYLKIGGNMFGSTIT